MATPTQARQLARRLGVEVRRPSLFAAQVSGVPVEPIGDPVLRELAEYPDWREYEGLMRLPEVSDPWQHVTSSVFAAPFEIQAGRNTPAAKVLAAKARWLWCRLPGSERGILLQRILDAEWLGWRPLQCVLEHATWPGVGEASRQTLAVPRRIVDKRAHHFRFTAGTERSLVFLPWPGQAPVIFSPEEVRAGWLVPRVRTLDDPYGLGLGYFAWNIAQAAWMVARKFYGAVDRQWNMIKVGLTGGGVKSGALREELEAVAEDLQAVTSMLAERNILLEAGKFQTQFIEKLQFIQSGVALLEHIRRTLQLLFQGGHLTSETSTAGPSGSAKVHQKAETDYALMRISCVENTVAELFANMFWLNGEDADPEDLPLFVSFLRLQLRESTVQTLFNLGAPLRAHRVAELLGATDVVASGGDEGELVLQKVPNPTITIKPTDPSMNPDEGVPNDGP